jgi:hypothetical protein
MTPEALASFAGIGLSLIMSYVPGLSTWYESRPSTSKRAVMALMLLVTAIGSAIWTCSQPQAGDVFRMCLGSSWRAYAQAFVAALVASQGTYMLTPKDKDGNVLRPGKAKRKAKK